VVDDDDVSRLVAEATLRKAGFDVTSVADAYAALNAIEDELPDLVLSDVSMPGLTGFELVVRLRADPRTATLPVIFLTGSAVEPAEVVAGLSVGADDHLLKPIDPGVLVARIERRLSGAAPLVGLRRVRPGGVLGYDAFVAEATREVARAERSHREGAIVAIEISERDRLVERLGTKALDGIVEELGASSMRLAGSLGVVGRDREGRLLLLVPESDPDVVRERALGLAQRLARQSYAVPGEHVHVTPAIGISVFGDETQAAEGGTPIGDLVARAVAAASVSRLSGDLRPTAWSEGLVEPPPAREVLPPR